MSKAKKYQVGVLARKHLLAALESVLAQDANACEVLNFPKYEIRATRTPHGVELKWGKHGTFYQPVWGDRA